MQLSQKLLPAVMTQLQDEKRENSKRTCTEQDGDKRL